MATPLVDLTGSSPPPAKRSIDAHTRAQLFDAIEESQEKRLRSTLRTVCAQVPEAASIAATLLLVAKTRDTVRDKRDGESDLDRYGSEDFDTESSQGKGTDYESIAEDDAGEDEPCIALGQRKKIRSRYAECQNCNEEFDVVYNISGACTYHPGELEPDEDMFVDWDEGPHGPMDTAANRREYPDHFIYDCCQQESRAEGCESGKHEEVYASVKRARYNR